MPGNSQKDAHGHAVPDEAAARAHVEADIHAKGDGHEHHDKALPDNDPHADDATEAPVPHGRWVDDAWVGPDEGAEL